jgi:3-hydroxybutyryl-CoA dehydratase
MSDLLHQAVVGSAVAEATFGPLDREDLRRYADASGDLNPLHLDAAFARRAGFEDVIVHGMLGMALLGRLLRDAFPSRKLLRFRTRFRRAIPVGKPIVCVARLMAASTAEVAEIALTAATDGGPVLIEGTATLALPEIG